MRTLKILTLLVTAGTLSVPAFAGDNPLVVLALKSSDSCRVVNKVPGTNGPRRLDHICPDYDAAKKFMSDVSGVMLFDTGLAEDGKSRNFQIELKKP